ncbi:PapB/FocB family fimbrial expression transcriptional regulator [Shewanella sp. T24-MNA-CIBAN-0130]|jgi:predicted DNA-binding protein (UPF0251 family)|uniref:PapB/FocB family fimbrial expression transcriptional regulator n=1 Tax=Shewanella sp. T24-MNA-CIBAN-0130 TaxID=3140470 RepID=UPI0033213E6C
MKYLIPGGEPAERMALLLQLTRIDSVEVIEALKHHYVDGISAKNAAQVNGITESNLSRAITRINEVAEVIEKVKAIDWYKFGYKFVLPSEVA